VDGHAPYYLVLLGAFALGAGLRTTVRGGRRSPGAIALLAVGVLLALSGGALMLAR
jgi:hypothetical protein